MKLKLSDAVLQTGQSKSTIWRAIKSGKMSAGRNDAGEYEIDAAELFRVFTPKSETEKQAETGPLKQSATVSETAETAEIAAKVAALESQISGLKELLDEVRRSREDWKNEAQNWKDQASKTTALTTALLPAPGERSRGSFWRRLVG